MRSEDHEGLLCEADGVPEGYSSHSNAPLRTQALKLRLRGEVEEKQTKANFYQQRG